MKSFRRSRKALSPVVASIILVAVTVAVSIAVAVWMGALSTGFMQTEQLTITSVQFRTGTPEYINVTASNTGTTGVKIEQVWVNGVQKTATYALSDGTAISDATVPANAKGVTIQVTQDWDIGNSYQIKLVSAKGTTFLYVAVAA
jgi:archaeal type IV pilus assembly protein PilA